jgi:cytochrome P450
MDPALKVFEKWILFQDAPDHTRIRKLVSQAFTPRLIEGLRSQLANLAQQLLGDVQDQGTFDLMRTLAVPLPLVAIAELMGVPRSDHDRLKGWSDGMTYFISKARMDRKEALSSLGDMMEMVDYFRSLVKARRDSPRADLVSSLVLAKEGKDLLTEDELLATCCLVLVAGHETTTNLIGNGFLALWRHPEQLEKLRACPSLAASAVEEMLRYDGPAHIVSRIALEDITIRGQQIKQGERVIFILGAANRDPEVFPEPEKFDITRDNNKHLAFGFGVHFCLGAALARLETQIALEAVLGRFPNMSLESSDPQWRFTPFIRGVDELRFSI